MVGLVIPSRSNVQLFVVAVAICGALGFQVLHHFFGSITLDFRSSVSDEPQLARILTWASAQPLTAGSSHQFALPARWAATSHGGTVNIGRSNDGRTCVLLKKQIGWKENFAGTVACDRPLLAKEVAADAKSRSYMTLPGEGVFEELYISRRLSDHRFDVYFDLN
jgi:hypothetical protein